MLPLPCCQAPPGAGKTTVVPLALLRHGPAYLRQDSKKILVGILAALSEFAELFQCLQTPVCACVRCVCCCCCGMCEPVRVALTCPTQPAESLVPVTTCFFKLRTWGSSHSTLPPGGHSTARQVTADLL